MAVGPVNFLAALGQQTSQGNSAPNQGPGFGQALNDAIANLSDSQKKADDSVLNFLTGNGQDVSQVTVAMEEAKVKMELAVEVRNKIVDAYKQVWQMSV